MALSKPLLALLVGSSVAPGEAPSAAPEPVTDTAEVPTEATSLALAVEQEETRSGAAAEEDVAAASIRPLRAGKRTSLLVTAFLLGGVALAGLGWPRAAADRPPTAPDVALAVRATAPRPAPAAVVEPSPRAEAPELPAPAPGAHAIAAVESPVGQAALLLAEPNVTAPTCEELLSGVTRDDQVPALDSVRVARRALIRGDNEASQRAFCRVVRGGNADATVFSELAQLLLLRRDAAAAAYWAQQAARSEPSSPRVLELLGDALVRTGKPEEARKAWLAAASVADGDAAGAERIAQANLGAAERALRERDPARAERNLYRVVVFQPENAAAHAKMADVFSRLGFPGNAERWSRRAAELKSQGLARRL